MNHIIAEKETSTYVTMLIKQKETLLAEVLRLGLKAHFQTHRCVFVEFYGHVNELTISVRRSTEEYTTSVTESIIRLVPYEGDAPTKKEHFYLEVIRKLDQTKENLEAIIDHGVVTNENDRYISTRFQAEQENFPPIDTYLSTSKNPLLSQ